jgi:hypothetical protein
VEGIAEILSFFGRINLHLAMLAIELQSESLAIGADQIVWFLVRRFFFVTHRTPPHAITKTMLAEHQYGILGRAFLKSRSQFRYAMVTIEVGGAFVHDIA